MGMKDVPPPLPPVTRRRSQSFTDKFWNPDLESVKATYRLSGSFEVLGSETPEGKLQLGYRSDLDAERETAPVGHRHGSSGSGGHRKGFMSRLFTGKGRGGKSALRRHNSDSVRSTHFTGLQPLSSLNGPIAGVPPPIKAPPPVKVSSIPERLLEKIRVGMRDCTNSTLPVQFFSRFIDVPGAKAFRAVRSLFVTDHSLCVLVYDTSKSLDTRISPRVHRKTSIPLVRAEAASRVVNGGGSPDDCMEESHFEQIMADFNNLGLHWSHSDADMSLRGQRVILVATHSDKVPSSISHTNFDQLRTAIKNSPYHKYVAMMKYVLSSSSVIERSNMEDLKRYIIEITKKSCRQQVPLKWLRCIRRFLSLSERGVHFITLQDAKKIVSETCDVAGTDEVDAIVRFLHNNQVILHFAPVHHLCELVFTSSVWFARQLSGVFGAAWVDVSSGAAAARLQSDQNRLQMRGILSAQLLDHVWKGESSANRRRLLAILHKMDLVCCLGPNTHPISPSASPSSIAQDIGQGGVGGVDQHSHNVAPGSARPSSADHVFSVSSLVVPSVVTEPMPLHLLQMPTFDLQPLHFRFKEGFVPYDVFPRLLTRCVHSYPTNYTLYSNAALFEVDTSTLLLISESKGRITVNLYQSRSSASTSPRGFAPVNLDDAVRLPEPANLDTCMAVQMFLQTAISDIIQQWLPQIEYDLCVECMCSSKPPNGEGEEEGEGVHHMVLSQSDNILQRVSLNCERGTQVLISVSLYSWFGEIPHPHSPEENSTDYITTEDIEVVCVQLNATWPVLGQALGFSRTELERIAMVSKTQVSAARKMMEEWKTLYKQNATFFALLGALEIIQRRDIADDLVAARMCGMGIDL
ncbi:hypothetical protein GBAR_LOCUS10103 [Geodia barretti]|uniref:Death domain-containing protein n=1 Tax=Geodia barretti TaxID=519541 RepID=A0AA35RU70_GEOBA|nr:hypothetical protein GBAR_LOCUS10103 [Geodia barretti]